MLVASLIAFLSSNQFATLKLAFNFWDPFAITQYRLSRLSEREYKDAIEQALQEGDISEAQTLVEIALEYGRELPAELVERTQENLFEFGLRHALDFIGGAATGEISNIGSVGGVLYADYIGIGDVRDILIHGYPAVRGEDYDKITLAFALVGATTSATIAASSAGTVATAGTGIVVTGPMMATATTVDIGASIIKNANKIGKLSQPLAKRIHRISHNIIDINGLKKALSRISAPSFKMPPMSAVRTAFSDINWRNVSKGDFSQLNRSLSKIMPAADMKAAKEALSGVIRKEAKDEMDVLARSAAEVVSAGGVKTAFRTMEHADDAKEFSRFGSLTARMGEKTSAVIKVLGKGAIKLGKLLYLVISILIAALGWVLGALWFLYSVSRTIYRITKRVKGAA